MSAGGGPSGGAGGTGSAASQARQTYIYWHEAALTTPAAVTGDDEDEITEADQIRRMLGMSEWDPKPVLLYFHRDHEEEDGNAGKAWKRQCSEIDDEKVARWAGIYHFVEVDVDQSDETMLERFGAGAGPSFAIVNQDVEVVIKSGSIPNAKKFAGFLKSTVKSQFEEYWATVQERLDEQKDALREAKSLEKQKDIVAALSMVRAVTRSSLRIGAHFDDAVKLDAKLTRKLANE